MELFWNSLGLAKDLKRSVCWNEYKTKSEKKKTTNKFSYFLESNFVESFVNRLFVLIFLNRNTDIKQFYARKYYLPKGVIENYNVIINGKNFYDQAIDSETKRHEEIRKLTTGQGEDDTTRCLLDYDCINNHYRLIALDLSGEKELDADPKATQQIKFIGQLKYLDDYYNAINADGTQNMFILTILEKIKETRLRFCQGSVAVL